MIGGLPALPIAPVVVARDGQAARNAQNADLSPVWAGAALHDADSPSLGTAHLSHPFR
jgi:hypothetical protein